jgi:hypothetical protein
MARFDIYKNPGSQNWKVGIVREILMTVVISVKRHK